jgi:hypothetical protein
MEKSKNIDKIIVKTSRSFPEFMIPQVIGQLSIQFQQFDWHVNPISQIPLDLQ